MNENRRKQAESIWRAGVEVVKPQHCLPATLEQLASQTGGWPGHRHYVIIGGGKAGSTMALATENYLLKRGIPKQQIQGWVNVPEGSELPLRSVHLHPARPIGYNYPTPQAVNGTRQILKLIDEAPANAIILCLLSGGGSAILSAPVSEVSLEDKVKVSLQLSSAGANIQELNAVRKHLSDCKGGRLAQKCFTGLTGRVERQFISLIISDVIGDPLDVIASGPTAVDPTTYQDAVSVLRAKGLLGEAPRSVIGYLQAGCRGEHPETLKKLPADEPFLIQRIVANNRMALDAASAKARGMGFDVVDLGDHWAGDTLKLGESFAQRFSGWRGEKPVCVLSGGETTVQLPADHGKGGRNQSLTLALLQHLKQSIQGITLLCAGTDGEDGPTDAAGAVADSSTLAAANSHGLNMDTYLVRHDAYHFFDAVGGLFRTGMTDTNVMDLRVFLIDPLNA